MSRKKSIATMYTFIDAGAKAQILYRVFIDLLDCTGRLNVPTKQVDSLMNLLTRYSYHKAKFDTLLFTQHPELGHDGCHVFYADICGKPRDEIEAWVKAAAHEYLKGLLAKIEEGEQQR